MKLSISNIAWDKSLDEAVYEQMSAQGYSGLEIAPTRIFEQAPYDDPVRVRSWYEDIRSRFVIPSMQSIWYGRTENIFGGEEEREALLQYTNKAVLFAEIIECNNLVFGCPKNRNMPDGADRSVAVDFFEKAGAFAHEHNTVIGIEANPVIYNTNFLNTTEEALDFIEEVSSPGIKLNLDVGTMIQNGEDVTVLTGREDFINHVHISEPMLKKICPRPIHGDLLQHLHANGYNGFVSIEMGKQDELSDIVEVMSYLRKVSESEA